MMADKGILVVVSGFSGAGKGTLMKRLLEKYDNYALSVCLRPPERQDREKNTAGNIFSIQSRNLKN